MKSDCDTTIPLEAPDRNRDVPSGADQQMDVFRENVRDFADEIAAEQPGDAIPLR